MTWQHNPLETLRISSSTKDSLRLSWQVIPNIENAVGGYQIRYRASGSSITQYSGKLDRMLRTWEISQLHENTDYEICFWTFLSSDASNTTNDYRYLNNTNNNTDLVARRSYEMLQDDPLLQNNSSPYCFESSTGVDAAKVAFVSTLGAFFAIGIVLFFVLLARWQEGSKKKEGTKKNGDEEEEEEEDERVARGCRRRRKRRKACRQCRGQQKEQCQCNKGFFSAFKVSKAFKFKRASSKQVLAHDSTPSHHHSSPHHHHQSPHHFQSPHHLSNDGSCKEAKSDKTSLHSSLLSLINEEPGNMFLVATSSDDKQGDENKDENRHELAYLIPIMKCQDGTLILGGTDDDGNEGDAEDDEDEEDGDIKKGYSIRQDSVVCGDDVDSDDDEDDMDAEECSDEDKKDFELLPVIFSPQLKLSVVDSVFMGDIVAVEDEEEEEKEEEEEEEDEEKNETKEKNSKEDEIQEDELKNGATDSFLSKARTSECILDKQEDNVAIRRTSSNVMPITSI